MTKDCQFDVVLYKNKHFLVVETPAILSQAIDENESLRELSKIIGITWPGFHAIVLVVKVGRFTEQDRNVFDSIARIFGSKICNRIIVLFTGLDNLESDGMSFTDYIKYHVRTELKDIITKCGNRVVGFNNRLDETNRYQQAHALFDTVDSVLQSNVYEPFYYSRRGLQAPEDFIKKETVQRRDIDSSTTLREMQNAIRRDIQREAEGTKYMLDCLQQELLQVKDLNDEYTVRSVLRHYFRCPFCAIL